MEVTTVGAAVILIAAFSLFAGPRTGAALLGATIPLSASAAIVLGWAGGATILCSVVAAGALIVRATLETAARALNGQPFRITAAGGFLIAFVFVAIVGGYALPRLFAGQTEIYALDRTVIGVADGVMRFPLTVLAPHAGNITQSILLSSSVALFFAAARLARGDPDLPAIILWHATGAQAVFALLDTMGAGVLDHFRTATYAIASNQAFAGFTRLTGGATEPSFFGGISTALCVWHLWRHRSTGRVAYGLAALAMGGLAVASLSSTAIAVLGVAGAIYLVQRLVASRSVEAFAGAFFLAAAIVAVVAWAALGPFAPMLDTGLNALFFDKFASESGVERAAWARQAVVNFADTSALGAGLGASRTSGWAMAVLGQTGAPGGVLITGFLIALFVRPMAPETSALRAACLALLAAAMLSASRIDLGPLFFALAGCVAAAHPQTLIIASPSVSQRPAYAPPAV